MMTISIEHNLAEEKEHIERLIGSIWAGEPYFICGLIIDFVLKDWYHVNQPLYRPLFLYDNGRIVIASIDLNELLMCEREDKKVLRRLL